MWSPITCTSSLEVCNKFNAVHNYIQNIKVRNENLLEAKAKLEDEVEALQAKVALISEYCLCSKRFTLCLY